MTQYQTKHYYKTVIPQTEQILQIMAEESKTDTDMDVATRGCRGYERAWESNWNGNISLTDAAVLQTPPSMDAVCAIVRDTPSTRTPIRVVGRGHSFTPLVQSSGGTILCLQHCNRILDYQPPHNAASVATTNNSHNTITTSMGSITLEGGTTYTEVIQFLRAQPIPGALPNLPSCPQFTVAGAIATGTHGSGRDIHNLSAHVAMLEFVKADGTRVSYDRNEDDDNDDKVDGNNTNNTKATRRPNILENCRVHLGCLGVISRLRLDVVPDYTVEAVRYDDIPLDIMMEQLPDWWTRCDSLSVWTSGFGRGVGKGTCWATFRRFVVVRPTARTTNDDSSDTTTTTTTEDNTRDLPIFLTPQELGDTGHICDKQVPRYCTDPLQLEVFRPTGRGPWYDYLTVTMDQGQETCMSTKDLQAEFFVPLEHAQAALRAVWAAVSDWEFSPPWGYEHPEDSASPPPKRGIVDAMEFRQVKGGDGAWLSPHNAGDSLGIHISFNGDPALRSTIQDDYLPVIEQALVPFGAKPHWGKLATPDTYNHSRIRELYSPSSLEQFQWLCNVHDPHGKFRNDFVNRTVFDNE